MSRGGDWPQTLDQVSDRFSSGCTPKDYWRRGFVYVPGVSVASLGRDGVEGGIGEDADVVRAL